MVLGKRFVREKDAKDNFVRQQAARDGSGAMRMFSLAIAMRPDDSEAWEKRGMTHQLLHDPKDALQDLNAALRLRPDFLLAHQNRAEVALELSKYAHDMDERLEMNRLAWDDYRFCKSRCSEPWVRDLLAELEQLTGHTE